MFDKDNKFGFIINNNENSNNIKNTDLPCTVSSKVLATVPASDINLDDGITVNNVSINKDRRYYIEFLGNKKLCSLLVSEELNGIMCSIGNYIIQAVNNSTDIMLFIIKINEDDTTDTFTDLVIYEEEVKYLDNKYLENDLVLQNSISLGRVGNIGGGSSAVGSGVEASSDCSHAEGDSTTASGECSHAEGDSTIASGYVSHAEGSSTTASGLYSHAEGNSTEASGECSHAEGDYTTAIGICSHTEGYSTEASGECSHAEGDSTIASGDNQHVQGKYNIEDKVRKYAHIVGNGAGDAKRSNAHTLDWKGNAWYAGKLSQEGTPTDDKDLATKKYVDDNILLEQLPILRIDETNKRIYINCNNMGTYKKYFVPNKYANVYGFSFIYTNEDSSETEIALVGGAMTRDDFILCARNTDTLFILILGGTDKYTYTKSTKTLEKGLYGYLKIGNTQEYTPTNDYNPATKKYVDDNTPIKSLPVNPTTKTGAVVDVNNITVSGCYALPKRTDGKHWTNLMMRAMIDDGSGKGKSLLLSGYQNYVFYVNIENKKIYCDNLRIVYNIGTTADTTDIRTEPYFLPTTNTKEYTPTNDYNPATKKYVDDKVKDTLVTTNISDTTLALTVNKYQTATVADGTEITLPTVTTFTEIHLFFSTTTDLTLTLPACKWQNGNIPTISANKTYEFIFTYVTEWLGGVIQYE